MEKHKEKLRNSQWQKFIIEKVDEMKVKRMGKLINN